VFSREDSKSPIARGVVAIVILGAAVACSRPTVDEADTAAPVVAADATDDPSATSQARGDAGSPVPGGRLRIELEQRSIWVDFTIANRGVEPVRLAGLHIEQQRGSDWHPVRRNTDCPCRTVCEPLARVLQPGELLFYTWERIDDGCRPLVGTFRAVVTAAPESAPGAGARLAVSAPFDVTAAQRAGLREPPCREFLAGPSAAPLWVLKEEGPTKPLIERLIEAGRNGAPREVTLEAFDTVGWGCYCPDFTLFHNVAHDESFLLPRRNESYRKLKRGRVAAAYVRGHYTGNRLTLRQHSPEIYTGRMIRGLSRAGKLNVTESRYPEFAITDYCVLGRREPENPPPDTD